MKSKCDAIVQLLPDDYEKTLQAIQDHLTDDEICEVLGSPNHVIANKTILNFLMEKVKCIVDILKFCEWLVKITPLLPELGALDQIISDLKSCKNSCYHSLFIYVLLNYMEKLRVQLGIIEKVGKQGRLPMPADILY